MSRPDPFLRSLYEEAQPEPTYTVEQIGKHYRLIREGATMPVRLTHQKAQKIVRFLIDACNYRHIGKQITGEYAPYKEEQA